MSLYPAGRPPGLSSDEDSDDDFGFSLSCQRKSSNRDNYFNRPKSLSLSPVEQLFQAVKNDNLTSVRELIDKKVNLNSIQGNWSPLMFACFHAYPKIVSILLENGADINFNKEFFTPLMAVCSNSGLEHERLKCVEILLHYNSDVNACDRFRSTSLMLASRQGHARIVKTLIERGANVNMIDKEGWTAVFHAVNYNQADIVHILIQAGANFDLKDFRGRTPADLAVIKGFDHIAALVSTNKEDERLDEELFNVAPVRSVKQMLNELPSKNIGVNPGFPSDVCVLLQGMNLDVYIPCFYRNNIQLGEFLVITNERLKEIGVRFSTHRQKILQSIKRFHLYRWQKSSIGLKPRDEKIELIDGLKLITNSVRQLHVIQSSLFYLQLNKPKAKSTDEFKKIVHNSINQTNLLQKELITLQSFALCVDSKQKVRPVDLIKKEQDRGKKIEKLIKIGVMCFVGGALIWKNKETCFTFFKLNILKT